MEWRPTVSVYQRLPCSLQSQEVPRSGKTGTVVTLHGAAGGRDELKPAWKAWLQVPAQGMSAVINFKRF